MLKSKNSLGFWLLAALSLAVMLLWGHYSWLYLQLPVPGFKWDSATWAVIAEDPECFPPQACVAAGDLILEMDGVTRDQYIEQRYQPSIRWTQPLSLKILRSGEERFIQLAARDKQLAELLEGILATLFPLVLWAFGTLTLLLLRPRDERWVLQVLAYNCIAVFFSSGTLSFTRLAYSPVVLHFASWFFLPILIHLHLVLPDLSAPRLRRGLIWLYGLAAFCFGLDWLSWIGGSFFKLPLLIGVLASLGIIVYQLFLPAAPKLKVARRLLFFGSVLGWGPWVAAMILFYNSSLEDLPFGVDSLLIWAVALLAVPNWPLSYIYSVYKPDSGLLRIRGSNLLGIYGFLSLSVIFYVTTFFFVGTRWLSLREQPIVASLLISTFFLAIAPPLRYLFQVLVDRTIFGIKYRPDEVVSAFAEKIPTAFDRDSLRSVIVDEILPTLSIRQSSLYLFGRGGGGLLYEQRLLPPESFDVSEEDPEFKDLLTRAGRYIPTGLSAEKYSWVRLTIPLAIQEQLIGVWFLGKRDPDNFYPKSDINILTNIANQIATVVRAQQEITENKRLHQQLVHAQKMEAIGRLSAGVAHDFNNLLTAILSYSELLLSRQPADSATLKYIFGIKDAGEKAEALTKQLLAFSRRQAAEVKVVNINAVVTSVEGLLRRLIGEDVELALNLTANSNVKIDPRQMEQVVLNLVVNANDAMPEGGLLAISTYDLESTHAHDVGHGMIASGAYTLLQVKDTGVGIDAEVQAHIFEPFFTTKDLSKGTGLGLSMVYGIVRQSDGYIFVDSTPGEGTTFSIYLPTVEEAETSERTPELSDAPAGAAETILVVEDEDAVRNAACEILRSRGYTVLQARNGFEAIDIFGQNHSAIDLLLTDVVMPQMKGPELAERLLGQLPDLKVMYMSGYYEESMFGRKMDGAGGNLIRKPFSSRSLTLKVREVLDSKPKDHAASSAWR